MIGAPFHTSTANIYVPPDFFGKRLDMLVANHSYTRRMVAGCKGYLLCMVLWASEMQ